MNSFRYQSDSYDRQSQRFVIPLYIQDELGDYNYSSTGTFILYNGFHYIVFSAHALNYKDNIDNVFVLGSTGEFTSIKSISIGYKVFKDNDLVIVDCFNKRIEGKNYFLLEREYSLIGFEKNYFAWTGFPESWCKTKIIHRTKKTDSIINESIVNNEEGVFFKNARYFTIISRKKLINNIELIGHYNIKKAYLKYRDSVGKGPHPKGMSGGAMYFFSKKQILKDDLNSTFRFAGIGLSFNKDGTISGISRDRVIDLFEQFDKDSPRIITPLIL